MRYPFIALVRKDLKGYFDQPTGYVLVVIFVALPQIVRSSPTPKPKPDDRFGNYTITFATYLATLATNISPNLKA